MSTRDLMQEARDRVHQTLGVDAIALADDPRVGHTFGSCFGAHDPVMDADDDALALDLAEPDFAPEVSPAARAALAFSELVEESALELAEPEGDAADRLTLRGAEQLALDFVLGQGGMGVVWAARQAGLDRTVAVKTLHARVTSARAVARFADEARVTGRLEHPNIVPVHAFGHDAAGRPWLVMKVVRGVEWGDLLAAAPDDGSALRQHLRILQRVCAAVAYAHDHGVLHRDLKPANVMIGEFGEVLLTDWGIALDLDERRPLAPGAKRALTGTPAYMAPEMVAGDPMVLGPWTDVYLLGGLLYEVLTGTAPHAGKSVLDAAVAAAAGDLEPPQRRAPHRVIPDELAAIARKALSVRIDDRYEDPMALSRAIDGYLENEAAGRLAAAALERLAETERAAAEGAWAPARVYGGFEGAIAGLTQALALWAECRPAVKGLRRARLACARFAVAQGDPTAAEAQLGELPGEMPEAEALRAKVAGLHAARAAAARRRRWLRVGLGGACTAALAFVVAGVLETQRAEAEEAMAAQRRAAIAAVDGLTWKDADGRIAMLGDAVRIDPTWREAYTELAGALTDRAYEKAPEDPGACAADLGQSAQVLTNLIDLDPGHVAGRYYLGYAWHMLGDAERAAAEYEQAAKLGPDTHDGVASASVLALREGRLSEAEALLERAVALGGDEDDHMRRAVVRYALGKPEQAMADLETLIGGSPTSPEYPALAALVLASRGDLARASEQVLAALRLHARSPHALPLAAWLAARRGDTAAAKALSERARQAKAAYSACYLDHDPVHRTLTKAPGAAGELGRAFLLDLPLDAVPPVDAPAGAALRAEAQTALDAGDPSRALAFASRALAADATDGPARLLRARALIALGHPGAARSDLALLPLVAPHLSAAAEALAP